MATHRRQNRALAANDDTRDYMGTFGRILQAGYFILAVRSVGLYAGPMAGCDSAGVDSEFFSGAGSDNVTDGPPVALNVRVPLSKSRANASNTDRARTTGAESPFRALP